MARIPDPYKILGLPHDANNARIKASYRKLAMKYHPDRLTTASPEEQQEAADNFASVAAAYQLLSDERKKQQYDHIYKFGGFDEEPSNQNPSTPPRPYENEDPFPKSGSKRSRSTGIGYTIYDPISFVMSKGQTQKTTVAGVQIPSRVHLAHPRAGGGFRFAFSSGEYTSDSQGAKKLVSKTTQIVRGKKYTRVETTTLHPDGRKEVVIEGDDYVERKVTRTPQKVRRAVKPEDEVTSHSGNPPEEMPWYLSTWNVIREKLTMCTNPCIQVH